MPLNSKNLVLIADDEKGVREILSEIIASLGFTPVTAFDGHESLRQFEKYPERFHALITDYQMSPMNGEELIRSLWNRPHFCPSRVILFTGRSFQDKAIQSLLQQGQELSQNLTYLHKDFLNSQLKNHLKKLL